MLPILLELGPFKVYSYGLVLASAFAVSTYLAMRQARKESIDGNFIIDLAILLVFFGIAGARLLFVLQNLGYFAENPLEIIMVFKGGLSMYGGILASFFGGLWFIKRRKKDFWKIADLLAPFIMLGQAIGRIGCFLNGCCYGKHTDSCLGVKFPALAHKVHPTQLYESAGSLLLFFILLYLKNRKHFKGQIFITYLLSYAALKFFIDFFRGDEEIAFLRLSLSQLLSIGIFIAALILYFKKRKDYARENI